MEGKGREKPLSNDPQRLYSLEDIEAAYSIPRRKLAFLIRTGALEASFEDGTISISQKCLSEYLDQPQEVIRKHHASYLKTLGPGLITGASDDDPSGIGTYTSIGSSFGLGLSWLAVYLLPMMTAVQETVARIGIVTQHGLAATIKKRYGNRVLVPLVFILLVANTVNIGADIGAMVSALQLLVPVDFNVALILLTAGIALLETLVPYHRYSKILKWLTLSLLAYVITAFLIRPDWLAVLRGIAIPHVELTPAFLAAMVATMGTTITPYLFFWQASEELEEKSDRGSINDFRTTVVSTELDEMRKDTYVGMSLANIVFLSIVITSAFVLNANGVTDVETASGAAAALKPLAGDFASLLFTLGIFGVGLLAVPVLAGSSAYALSELLGWKEGLGKKTRVVPGFYAVIVLSLVAGLLLNLVGINPIKALYYAAILNGVAAPLLMAFIFHIGSDEKVMGPFVSPLPIKVFGWIATVLMGVSAVALIAMVALGM
jgi:Mn2+/Fe2+ NRAMP family transporter